MQVPTVLNEPSVRFDAPVRSLLRTKDDALWSISPEATVYEAIQLMSEKHIGCLLVLSGGRLTGIVTERDYARKVVLMGRASQKTLVREIMSAPVLSVREDDTLDEAMRLMTTRRLRHLPVLRGDSVVGMISIGDLVNFVINAQHHTIEQLTGYINGSYPG
jgi:signal-transduction protein with cAMP-binding, CBS, and nucleotidyltransferase domain